MDHADGHVEPAALPARQGADHPAAEPAQVEGLEQLVAAAGGLAPAHAVAAALGDELVVRLLAVAGAGALADVADGAAHTRGVVDDIVAAMAVGAVVKGVTGSGLPTIAIPVMAGFLGVERAVVVMAIPTVVTNSWLLWEHRHHASGARDLPLMLGCGVLGAVAGVWAFTGFGVITLTAGLTAISPELVEAARVDGARPLQIIRHVLVPGLRGSLVIVGTISFIFALRTFDIVWVVTQGGPATDSEVLAVLLYQQAFQFIGDAGLGTTVAVIMSVVLVLAAYPYLRGVIREEQR